MPTFIKRHIISDLLKHLESKEITLLVGPRQAGKTTIMLHLKEILGKKKAKTLHLDIDRDDHRIYFNSQTDLVNYLNLFFGNHKGYVFIDEIQNCFPTAVQYGSWIQSPYVVRVDSAGKRYGIH